MSLSTFRRILLVTPLLAAPGCASNTHPAAENAEPVVVSVILKPETSIANETNRAGNRK